MCEDRALRLRKGTNARLNRLHQLRYRARVLQRLQESPPPNQNDNSSESPSPSDQTPVSSHSSLPSQISEFRPTGNLTIENVIRIEPAFHRYADPNYCKLPPNVRARNEGLIEIAMRTVILMKKNQQLQRKLAALQAETSNFIQSVMNNPENRRTPPNAAELNSEAQPIQVKVEKVEIKEEEGATSESDNKME